MTPAAAQAGNTAVSANDDSYTVTAGEILTVNGPGVLENDESASDISVNRTVSGPSNGTLTLHSNGSLEYTPDPGYTGEDTFTYEASDGNGSTDTATVTVTVREPVNYSDLAVSNTTVVTNESVDVTATVTNDASSSQSYTAEFERNGTVVDTKSGVLASGPGVNTTVTFRTSFLDAGTYNVTINDLPAKTITVEDPITYSGLTVSTPTVAPNESVDVSATVTNDAPNSRSFTAELERDGTVVDTETGTLAAGADTQVTFSTSFSEAGTYDVTISNLTATSVVVDDTLIPGCRVVDDSGHYTLDGDIAENATDGCIEVTASDVVIDGQGHTLDGVDETTGIGVAVTGSGLSNVTVRNLTVTGFDSGVKVVDAAGVTLRNVTANLNGNDGVHLDGVDDATIVDADLSNNYRQGIWTESVSTSLVVRSSTISSNGEGGGGYSGVYVGFSSADVTVENSTIDANPGEGIGVFDTTGVAIRNNTISSNGGPGVVVTDGAADATVADNDLTANQLGIQVGSAIGGGFTSADDATLSNNTVSGSANEGIQVLGSDDITVSGNDVTNVGTGTSVPPPFAINVTASNGATVEANTVENNPFGGIYLLGSADGNVRGNDVSDGQYGLITEDATDATVEDNTVAENTYDGIAVIGGSDAVVESNTATGNEWGLFLAVTENVTAVGNDVSGNVNGTALDAATDVTLTDTEATGNTDWAIYAENGSTVAAATNYTIVDGGSLNFSAHDIGVSRDASPPALPAWKAQFGPYLYADNTAADGWLNLTVGYDGSALSTGQNESTMRLWRHDGSWADDVGGTNAVDEFDDTVTANVTDFSTFALLADEEPVMNLSTDEYDFGDQHLDDSNDTASVPVTNDGAAPLNVTGVGITGDNASEFATPAIIENITIQPGDTDEIDVEFGPSARGTKNATLVIAHDASDEFSNVSVSGTGVAPDVNVTSTTPVEFGDIPIGELSGTRTVTIENNGTAPLNLIDAEIRGPDSPSFDFSPGEPTPYLLRPGQSRTAEVEFQPLSAGDKTAYLDVTTNSTEHPQVNVTLAGTGVDTTPPTLSDVTIADDDGDGYVNGTDSLSIQADASDAETGIAAVAVNASSLGAGNFSFDGDELPIDISPSVDSAEADGEGPHAVTVTATDEAGNPVSENATISLDTTPPTATITKPTEGTVLNDSDPRMEGTTTDEISGVGATNLDIHYGDAWEGTGIVNESTGHWEAVPIVGGLADGEYTLTAQPVDNASNVGSVETVNVTVDTTPPTISDAMLTTDAGGAYLTDGDQVTVSATVTDATTNVESVTANASAFGAGTIDLTDGDGNGNYTATFTVDGAAAESESYALFVNATDTAGNENASTTNTLALDVDAPTIEAATLTDATDGNGVVNASDQITVEAIVTDPESGVANVTADASAFGAGTVELTDGNDDDTYDATVAVDEGAADPDGNYSVSVTAVDGVDLSNETATNALVLDTTDPTLTVTHPDEGAVLNDSDPRMEGDVTDALSGAVTVDVYYGSAWEREAVINHSTGHWETPPMVGGLNDGEYTLTAQPTDNAGNVGRNETINVTVDTTQPTVSDATVTTDAGGAYITGGDEVTVSANVTDATTNVESVTTNASAFGAGTVDLTHWNGDSYTATFTVDASAAENGTHSLDVTATDEAGNGNASTTNSLSVDTSAPTVENATLTDAKNGDGAVNATDEVGIEVTVTDADSGVENVTADVSAFGAGTVTLTDGNGDDTYGATVSVDGSVAAVDGNHSVTVTAEDKVDLSNETATNVLALDTTGPTVTITTPTDGAVLNTSTLAQRATADDATSGVALVEFDWGDGWTDGHQVGDHWEYPTPETPTPVVLPDGSHTVTARATDEAGNVGPAETVNVTVDTTDPVVEDTALGREDGLSPDATVDVSVNASDPTTAIEAVTVDGDALTRDGTWWNGTVRASQWLGTYSANVTVTDEAGNAVGRALNYTVGTEHPLEERDSETVHAEPNDGSVQEVAITLDGESSDAVDNETVLVGTPESNPVADAPGGDGTTPLQFFQANTTIDNANIEEGVLNVSVSRDRIDRRYIVPENLSFWVYDTDAGTWMNESVTGEFVAENGSHRFYEVTVPHFSTFAISGEMESTAPTVTLRSPGDGATVDSSSVTITADYSDDYAGIDTGNVTMQVDGDTVTDAATVTPTEITYDTTGLDEGQHVVTLIVPDSAGNTNTEEWSFTVETSTNIPADTPSDGGVVDNSDSDGDGSDDTGGDADDSDDGPTVTLRDVNVSRTTVETGETVTVNATLATDGTRTTNDTIALRVNGVPVRNETLSVPAEGTRTVTLTHSFDDPGEYALAIGNESVGPVTVEADRTTTTEPTDRSDETTDTADDETNTDSGMSPTERTTGRSTPGFGVIVALLSLLAAALLALRRH
ncbi:right-handed parallel beta-helix repeat-containing protein [Halostella salina]|uniref:right-handed parallel beta-helix repeat-containing protein n=1 Tax=Halostella salina TaxID=1547897 RepID=UPI0013CF0A75|nr:right-handed parallel beta-helix repeat-containing protein [Halostella salina]